MHSCGRIEVDLGRRQLRVHGAPAALGERAFAIVAALLKASGELVTKDELMGRIWPGVVVEENTLEVHVSALRKAMGAERALLRTVYGRGYRLLGDWTTHGAGGRSEPEAADPTRRPARSAGGDLPLATSELIGRATPLARICELLASHRMVTLTGLGGIGKTRLAVEAARRCLDGFGGDARLVELAPLSDPGLVPSTAAAAIGLHLGAAAPEAETVARAIGDRRLLIVLDNCEHVVDAAAGLAEAVVRACPHARILATSRENLRADGERIYRVPPLDIPPPDLREPAAVLGHGAVALLVERLRASDARIALREEDLATAADICRRLDGVPLAIEFAAARVGALGLRQVLSRLDDRFGLLTGGRRTALPRQQTLRATLDWSYALLPEVERMLLRRVAPMSGGFTLEAATAVVGRGERHDEARGPPVLESLANLVGKALIVLEESDTVARWRLLDTVRAYAFEKLAESGETEDTARRHATFYRDLFVPTNAARDLAPTVERMAVYAREIDNVRAALDWAFDEARSVAIGVSLTAAYVPFLLQLSSMVECRDRARRALAHLPEAGLSAGLEAQLQITFGLALVYTTDEVERAGVVLEKAVEVASGLEDVDLLLQALWATFIYKLNNSMHREARSFAERFLDLASREGEPEDVLMGDRVMGTTMHYAGDQVQARRFYDDYLHTYAAPRLHRHMTWQHYDGPILVRARLSRVLCLQGLVDQAQALADQNVRDARGLNHPMSECLAIGEAACPIAAMTGDFDAARRHLTDLVEIATRQSFSFWLGVAKCLDARLRILGGDTTGGAIHLRTAMDAFGGAHQSMQYAGFIPDLIAGVAAAGDLSGATSLVEEALDRAELSGVEWHVPELLRVKGELLLRGAGPNAAERSETSFRSAIALAERQAALFWELRASLSLARLWAGRERRRDARRLVQRVYEKFTEGFETADLRSARTLLGEIAEAD